MQLYTVWEVDEGYEGFESLDSIWLQEVNARKALESLKELLLAGRADTRFKQWWVEETESEAFPGTWDKTLLTRFRLYDKALHVRKDHSTQHLAELRVLQTGDEHAA